jgi:hypothetical protein
LIGQNPIVSKAAQCVYEVRPRKDHRGVDLISDALPFVGSGKTKRITPLDTRSSAADHELPITRPLADVVDSIGLTWA